MKNLLIMLVVALAAVHADAVMSIGYVGGRVRGYKSGDSARRLGEGGADDLKKKRAVVNSASSKAKSITEKTIVIPEDWKFHTSKIDESARIKSLCGFNIGDVAKLPSRPVFDSEGNIVMTGKLKKPFRKCTQYEVKYSKVNHGLYSIRVFSPAQKMDKESAAAEVSAMAAAVKAKFDAKILSWSALPTFYIANMKVFSHQTVSVGSSWADIDKRNKLNGTADAMPEKGWAFSLELFDRVMYEFDPAAYKAKDEAAGAAPSGVDAL